MTTLALHYHPLSSYCHKVLIAIDVLGIAVEKRLLNLGDSTERENFMALWPTGKMPLLIDGARAVPETSIIIEHLQRHHAGGSSVLIPQDPEAALEVRLWDRLFDLYVMTPMQTLTADLLRAESDRDALGRWPRPGRSSCGPMHSLTSILKTATGRRALNFQWPIAQLRRPCSMPRRTFRCCHSKRILQRISRA